MQIKMITDALSSLKTIKQVVSHPCTQEENEPRKLYVPRAFHLLKITFQHNININK